MTRPESHREQRFEKCCESCKHSNSVKYRDDTLCCYGDKVAKTPYGDWYLNGLDIVALDGDEYDKAWGGRVVHPDDICDCWESRTKEASGDE